MTRVEVRWAVTWALVVMLITCLPYLYTATLAPAGTSFSGLLYAADDHCVYLSWEQQGAQGQFRMRNLFTGESQRGIYVSLLSWFLGSVARFTGLPLILVHHGARVLFGALTLVLAYRLFAFFTPDVGTRRAAFWFAAFSAGFGWLFQRPVVTGQDVVDLWQPEAITFLCLYVNGLFCVALSLMLGIFILLLAAEGVAGWRRWGYVVGAGLLGLLLGNIHSYDVITVAGVWAAFVTVRALAARRVPGRSVADAVVAGLVALPSTAYQYYLYRTEPVFRMRADDKFLSPPLTSYLLGYGLVLLLAVGGALWLLRLARRDGQPLGQRLFPLTWAVVGFAIPYLPFAFQRKLLLGAHLPLAFLAAVGAMALARRFAPGTVKDEITAEAQRTQRKTRLRRSSPRPLRLEQGSPPVSRAMVHRPRGGVGRCRPYQRLAPGIVVASLLLMTLPTNLYFVKRDVAMATQESGDLNELPAFWSQADLKAVEWARRNLPADGLIFCSTVSGRLFPALAGRPVYVGHWSETPHANERMRDTIAFYRAANATSAQRRAFLQARGIRYVYQGTIERRIGAADLARDPIFRPIYRNDGAALYELRPLTTAQTASLAGASRRF
jgi:hypothetical protein